MRNAFAKAVTDLAQGNSHLVLLAGDIGNRMFDTFKDKYPTRFYNCGVAEAGMTGLAAGLAASGLLPITYTITPFNTLRCLEQIRDDVCYPDLPVILVGTGGGLSYANLGATHHSMDDIAAMRILPNMHVICPGDPVEVKLAVEAALDLKRPTYIRIGKKGEPIVHTQTPSFKVGKGIVLREGSDIALIGVGNVLPLAQECTHLLADKGLSAGLISLHTIKPLDHELLLDIFNKYKLIAVVEEHALAGGAGSAILEWGCTQGVDLRKLRCFAGPDRFLSACGDQIEARTAIGLDSAKIVQSLVHGWH
ncbi:MAG: transketolase [Cyanobacteria bacterium REEB494]|uniref:transketolase family protein n=1 Tax=Cylindrospermopsis raciborskii TaxID=77022 RepID=UPI000B5E7A56|nr:transketolase C-terminal domain-containing protein [Cylindrospermopsis raciborskii]MBU6346139.1 transketolase [Cyanobacteria bacterium REEB494]BAZ91304.1 transketolase C-terminal subunit [Raphidiopsis curvata NIES-932]